MRKFTIVLFAIIASVVAILSCKKEEFNFDKLAEIEWNPHFAAPIAYAKMNMRDLLEDYDTTELFKDDASNLLYIMYSSDIYSFEAPEKFKIGTQVYNSNISNSEIDFSNFTTPGSQATITKEIMFDFVEYSPNDGELDSIFIKELTTHINITSTFKHTATLKIELPTLSNGSQHFTKTMIFNYSGQNSITIDTTNTGYAGYKLDLTQGPRHTHQLPIKYTLTLYNSGNPTTGNINMSFSLQNLKYHSIFGYMGQTEVMYQSDTVFLQIYKSAMEDAVVYFENPQLNIYYKNSFGIPINFYFNNISAFSQITETSVPIVPINGSSELPVGQANSKTIAYPLLSQFGMSISDSIKLNKNVCNINTAIGIKPKYVNFTATAKSNAAGVNHTNFIKDDSKVEAKVEVVLPLWGYAYGFGMKDTSDFDIEEYYGNAKNIELLMFRINAKNGFPIDIDLQVYIADSNYVIFDSLITDAQQRVIAAGITDSDGRVNQTTGSTTKVTDITFNRERIDKLHDRGAKYLFYFGTLQTRNHPDLIKIYSDYNLDVHTATQVKIKAKPSDF